MTNLLFRCISLPEQNFICKTRNPTATSRYFSTNNNNNNNKNNNNNNKEEEEEEEEEED